MQPTSLNDDLESIDLTTENLPAVDTPDACDKAALRYVCSSSELSNLFVSNLSGEEIIFQFIHMWKDCSRNIFNLYDVDVDYIRF